jgi:ribosomal protein S18 acetylase RimI-like enzyme
MRKFGENSSKTDDDLRAHLGVFPVKRHEHFSFNLCDFNFFRKSNGGNYLFFGSPRVLAPIVAVTYVLACEVVFFRGTRFFVKLRNHVAGVLIVRRRAESLYISSLAVAPEYRRLGLGKFILSFAEKLAVKASKNWLELSVLKANSPARSLYGRTGFNVFRERRRSLTLRKRVV